jgi:hypothetical protein
MILGSTLAVEAGLKDPTPFMFFPLVVHAMDIVVSSVGILYVGASGHMQHKDPMTILTGGYRVSAVGWVGGGRGGGGLSACAGNHDCWRVTRQVLRCDTVCDTVCDMVVVWNHRCWRSSASC